MLNGSFSKHVNQRLGLAGRAARQSLLAGPAGSTWLVQLCFIQQNKCAINMLASRTAVQWQKRPVGHSLAWPAAARPDERLPRSVYSACSASSLSSNPKISCEKDCGLKLGGCEAIKRSKRAAAAAAPPSSTSRSVSVVMPSSFWKTVTNSVLESTSPDEKEKRQMGKVNLSK